MRDEVHIPAPYRVVILTLDSHAAGACARAETRLAAEFPGLRLITLPAAEWGEDPAARARAEAEIARADIVVASLLFLDEHLSAIRPALEARRDRCDAMAGIIADSSIVRLTRMGSLDMTAPESGTAKLLKKLRGGGGAGNTLWVPSST